MTVLKPSGDVASSPDWKTSTGSTALAAALQDSSDYAHRLDGVDGNPSWTGQQGASATAVFKLATGGTPPTIVGTYRNLYAGAADDYHYVRLVTPPGFSRDVETPVVLTFPQAAYDETTIMDEIADVYGQQRMTKLCAHLLDNGFAVVSCRAGQSTGVDKWGNRSVRDALVDVAHYVRRNLTVPAAGLCLFGASQGGGTMFNALVRLSQEGIGVAAMGAIDAALDLRDLYDPGLNSHDQGTMQNIGADETMQAAYNLSASCVPDDAEWLNDVNTEGGTGSGIGHNPRVANYSTLPDTPVRLYWNDNENVVDSDHNSVPMAARLTGTYSWTDVSSVDTAATTHLASSAFDDVIDDVIPFFLGAL